MFKTSNGDAYEELCQKKKYFKMEIHLFAAALAIGLLENKRCENKPTHDIVRLNQLLKEEHQEIREIINILSQVAYVGPDKRLRGDAILTFADGGLEILWKDYQAQGILDIPRILEDSKKKWPERIPDLLNSVKKDSNNPR